MKRTQGASPFVSLDDVVDRPSDAVHRTIHPEVVSARGGMFADKIKRVS